MQLPRRKNFVVRFATRVLHFHFSFSAVTQLKAGRRNLSPVVRERKETSMEQGRLAFTAVYLRSNHGYIGFIEELPGVNSHGRTLDEARETLQKLAAVVFDEERREAEELIAGKDVVRESFFVPIPRAA
jgi:predicted RNase H-like HicB family nuclease